MKKASAVFQTNEDKRRFLTGPITNERYQLERHF